jgi:glycosyltransferase involved in cell wall biosynthesis
MEQLNFIISVIIPVYNAEKYVEQAVNSAVNLNEVGEIILIEDGSKDNSLEICKRLSETFSKVKLFNHEDNKNKGASESRNLGILKSSFNYISFLDADDIYCYNRFTAETQIFKNNKQIDGVYSSVGYIGEPNGKSFPLIKKKIAPNKLFYFLVRGTYGHFHTNGITVKKSVFNDVGFFNPELILHQDSDMWLKLALMKKLASGELKSNVALIRRHEGNRIWKHQSFGTKFLLYKSFYNWVVNKDISYVDMLILLRKIAKLKSKMNNKWYILIMFSYLLKFIYKKKID